MPDFRGIPARGLIDGIILVVSASESADLHTCLVQLADASLSSEWNVSRRRSHVHDVSKDFCWH